MTNYPTASNLDELLTVLRTQPVDERAMTRLPVFGGQEPADTRGVWSWDETRLLVGTCAADFRIVAREDGQS